MLLSNTHLRGLKSIACTYGGGGTCYEPSVPSCCQTRQDDGTLCRLGLARGSGSEYCPDDTPYAACCQRL